MDRLRLSYVHIVEGGESAGQEHIAPVNSGEVVDELGIRHLMVVGLNVAQLHAVVAGLGDARLNIDNGLHLLLGSSLVVARHEEELLQISLVSFQDALVLRIVGKIVVAGVQSESALTHSNDVPLRIFLVGAYAYAKHHGTLTIAVELRHDQLILLAVLDGTNLGQRGLDGSVPLAVHARRVHHQVVERSYLLSERTLRLLGRSILQNDVLYAFLIEFKEIGERAVAGVLSVERVTLQPSSGSIMVEVVTGTNTGVEVLRVDARRRGGLCEGARSAQRQAHE